VVTLRDAGEFGLIERLKRVLEPSSVLALGIGDDAAIWYQDAATLVATTDMLVEAIHFDLAFISWHDLGWKALAVNLSDVAAMGASPVLALVSLGLRATAAVADVETLYKGMQSLALEAHCAIAGGDTVSVRDSTVLNVAVLGSIPAARSGSSLRRDRGRPGDAIAVTGTLGASAAGFHVLQLGLQRSPTPSNPSSPAPADQADRADLAALAEAHVHPVPRLAAGQALRHAGVRCAMDVSDGLLADLAKLCVASGCGADVHADLLPIHPALLRSFPDRALAWAAGGGEDYELLCAAPPGIIARASRAVNHLDARSSSPHAPTTAPAEALSLTEIGHLTAEPGVRLLDSNGEPVEVQIAGWDHFDAHE
jgi:thiamine-monophosphate kinase